MPKGSYLPFPPCLSGEDAETKAQTTSVLSRKDDTFLSSLVSYILPEMVTVEILT